MRAFSCPHCRHLVYFENVACLRCGAGLGFDPDHLQMVQMAQMAVGARPDGPRRCANQALAGCNWVLVATEPAGLCRSCRLTRTRPDDADLDGDSQVAERFVHAEAAKRRLVFQLHELELPIVSRHDDAECGLAFDFLVRKDDPIMIGHDDGIITIDLAESDDAYRERMRAELGEPYRTMLGHLRHEVGHYYWDVLVSRDAGVLGPYRQLFGDERADYLESLKHHYEQGPPSGWEEDHVSAYAAAHPWEDWAETWAHYLHIRDSIQTAASHGVIVTGPRFQAPGAGSALEPSNGPAREPGDEAPLEPSLISAPDLEKPQSFDEVLEDWLPLTYALNAINRSMGNDDLYPFVLNPKVIEKLRFVHDRVQAGAVRGPD